MARIDVTKTYKLYIGGAFPRSESGRTYLVHDAKGELLANAAQASRKDARDAVVGGPQGRSAAGPAHRLQPRPGRLPRSPRCSRAAAPSSSPSSARPRASTAARPSGRSTRPSTGWVWYAGWADKIAQVVGNANPVAGPYFNLSAPEPTGVVAVVAPQESSLLGLVSVVAPVIVTGNTASWSSPASAPAARRSPSAR